MNELLSRALECGRSGWPGLSLAPEVFFRYLEPRLSKAGADLRWSELYLTCACAEGDERAIRALQDAYFPALRIALARVLRSPGAREEAEAQLKEHLLVARAGSTPKIAEYSGSGELANWLRITAVRLGLRVASREWCEVPMPAEEDALLAFRAPQGQPELEIAKEQFRGEFKAAFATALGTLTARDRNLLRYHYIDGLSTEAVADLHRVHRATAVRWLAAARHTLLQSTREELRRRLGGERLELESLMRFIGSRLRLTLPEFLGTTPTGE